MRNGSDFETLWPREHVPVCFVTIGHHGNVGTHCNGDGKGEKGLEGLRIHLHVSSVLCAETCRINIPPVGRSMTTMGVASFFVESETIYVIGKFIASLGSCKQQSSRGQGVRVAKLTNNVI